MKKLIATTSLILILASCGGPDNGNEDSDGVGLTDHRIFISSSATTGDMNGGTGSTGLAKGDDICNDLADAAGLTRSYKAILSDDTADTSSMLQITGSIYTVTKDGVSNLIAEASSEFWDADTTEHKNLIDYDENGELLSNKEIWTGSFEAGTSTDDDCSNWTSTGGNATFGDNSEKNSLWIESSGTAICSTSKHLYCISQ